MLTQEDEKMVILPLPPPPPQKTVRISRNPLRVEIGMKEEGGEITRRHYRLFFQSKMKT